MKIRNTVFYTLILFLLSGCSSFWELSYTPEYNEGFEFDEDYSFAMNVVEGSVGQHGKVRDTKLPEAADLSKSSTAILADSYIGLLADGVGGALLGAFGGSSNYPFDSGYGIFYIPVSDFSKESLDKAYASIDQLIIETTSVVRNIDYSHTIRTPGGSLEFVFEGEYCAERRNEPVAKERLYKPSYLKKFNITKENQCNTSGYYKLDLLRFSSVTPDGENGKFAVIGATSLGRYTSTEVRARIGGDFYFFSPGSSSFAPHVIHKDKVWYFIKPIKNTSPRDASLYSRPLEDYLLEYNEWLNKRTTERKSK